MLFWLWWAHKNTLKNATILLGRPKAPSAQSFSQSGSVYLRQEKTGGMNTPIANWLAGWYILDWRTLGLAKRNHLDSDSCVKYLSTPERGRFLHKLDYSLVLLFIYYTTRAFEHQWWMDYISSILLLRYYLAQMRPNERMMQTGSYRYRSKRRRTCIVKQNRTTNGV